MPDVEGLIISCHVLVRPQLGHFAGILAIILPPESDAHRFPVPQKQGDSGSEYPRLLSSHYRISQLKINLRILNSANTALQHNSFVIYNL
jgi:hypothetical protein